MTTGKKKMKQNFFVTEILPVYNFGQESYAHFLYNQTLSQTASPSIV